MASTNGKVRYLSILPNFVAAVYDRPFDNIRRSQNAATEIRSIAIKSTASIVARRMKILRAAACIASLLAFLLTSSQAFAGEEGSAFASSMNALEPPRFELAVESAYLLGFINSPHSYEIGAEFLTARVRWGVRQSDGWLRGYNQFYFSAVAAPIFRGIENHYFGINAGPRYNFVRPGSRFAAFFSAGVGLGWIDSQPEIYSGQGQDFTFNIVGAVGVTYRFSDHFSGQIGLIYQHFSNAGLTDPNPSLNLLGLQLGLVHSF